MDKQINLLGIPLDLGAKNLGVDIGPQAFRYQDIVSKLRSSDLNILDHGDITVGARKDLEIGQPNLHYIDEIVRVNQEVAEFTFNSLKNDQKVVAIGGDHSINLGLISGASAAYNQDIAMIYFDAHGDMNTDETTLSGNIHGMHLAALLGFGDSRLVDLYKSGPKLAKNKLLHVGASDLDQAEIDLINRENLTSFSLFDLLTKNLAPLIDLIDDLAKTNKNIWISLDLDSIDQIYAPGAGMPNAKGLTYREIATIAEYVGSHCNVVGIDVVEYNPLQDVNNKTTELGIELIAKFLGKNYSWYTDYMQRNQMTN